MATHQTHKNSGAQRYINPTRVPAKKKIKIYRDDPRNIKSKIESSDTVYEVVQEDAEISAVPELDFENAVFSESVDPEFYEELNIHNNETDDVVVNENIMNIYSSPFLDAPTNLNIDITSFRLEDYGNSGDGTVRWIASLSFDDVAGAENYEYTINAAE